MTRCPPMSQKQHSVLMSVIAGEAVASVRSLGEKQVLQQCMATLRELFKEQVRGTPRGQRQACRHLERTSGRRGTPGRGVTESGGSRGRGHVILSPRSPG